MSSKKTHSALASYIEKIRELTKPESVVIFDGSSDGYQDLLKELVLKKTLEPLSREGSFLARSTPDDVARLEEVTFICSKEREEAGPNNRWQEPNKIREELYNRFNGCMQGRVMYVIPYRMGPKGSPLSKLGIEITDSAYVVANMYLMTTTGKEPLLAIEEGAPYVAGVHSVGRPLLSGEEDVPWPSNSYKVIAHFPEEREIWSFGSGYGGNALLGKKCFALRIASKMAEEEGTLAEHMLIIGITNPKGKKRYFAAAFPSGCGKTNLALLEMDLPGWKLECVGDDIAWMWFKEDGRLYAINPEQGFFGIAPGTSKAISPHIMKMIEKDTLFTNVAETKDKDVWWEGMTKEPPEELIDWHGKRWDKSSKEAAAQPNARFTVSKARCPILDPNSDNPQGVPIDAILFGGRRSSLTPLVMEARDWRGGVLMGASLSSEKTAAAVGKVGELRHDPFAMLPFCGYDMGDYFAHWLSLAKRDRTMPRIYSVNWFRKDEEGGFLWPGYKENAKVLAWIFERLEGEKEAIETPIGLLPKKEAFPIETSLYEKLFSIDKKAYLREIAELREYFAIFGERFPWELEEELTLMEKRLL